MSWRTKFGRIAEKAIGISQIQLHSSDCGVLSQVLIADVLIADYEINPSKLP